MGARSFPVARSAAVFTIWTPSRRNHGRLVESVLNREIADALSVAMRALKLGPKLAAAVAQMVSAAATPSGPGKVTRFEGVRNARRPRGAGMTRALFRSMPIQYRPRAAGAPHIAAPPLMVHPSPPV